MQKLDQAVTLREEVENVTEYINIQKARFRDRIKFVMDIDERALDSMIPCLTLQPILENAFVHGIEQMESGAVLKLAIGYSEDSVEVEIRDNGVGMNAETVKMLLESIREESSRFGGRKGQTTGLGTHNVFKRLHLFFDGQEQIDIESAEGTGTAVLFTLPYRMSAS
ncbi:Sensor histidine kinase YpdA [compost metagenome]